MYNVKSFYLVTYINLRYVALSDKRANLIDIVIVAQFHRRLADKVFFAMRELKLDRHEVTRSYRLEL